MNKTRLFYFLMIGLFFSLTAHAQKSGQVVNPDSVYKFTDVQAMYPGGNDSLAKFLSTHLKYPEKARQDSTVGRVVVQFVVDQKGNITDIKILKSLSPECDAEVIRVLNLMPSWRAG